MVSFKSIKTALAPKGQNANEIHVVLIRPDIFQVTGLGILVLYNIAMLVLGVVVAHGAWWKPWWEVNPSTIARVYLLYSTLPFVATIYSVVEFIMGWNGRLKRLQVLITAPVFFVLYILYCITTSTQQFCDASVSDTLECAYRIAGVETWKFIIGTNAGALAYHVGFAAIPAAVLYLLYFVWAVFFMQPGHKTVNMSRNKPMNDAESEYSFSTMPASTVHNLATMPSSRVTSPTPPRYFHQAGPSHGAQRFSEVPSYRSAELPEKH